MSEVKLAVIGGSGVYDMEALTDIEERRLSTPFGDPSDTIVIGTLAGNRIAFLPRHGRGHRLTPTEVPYRANIWALKSLGVETEMVRFPDEPHGLSRGGRTDRRIARLEHIARWFNKYL